MKHPVTPDGRYFVVRERLWRMSDPSLDPAQRDALVRELMQARNAKQRAIRSGDETAREAAKEAIDTANIALGERGDPWWDDGAPDYNRKMVRNTPYAAWFENLEQSVTESGSPPNS